MVALPFALLFLRRSAIVSRMFRLYDSRVYSHVRQASAKGIDCESDMIYYYCYNFILYQPAHPTQYHYRLIISTSSHERKCPLRRRPSLRSSWPFARVQTNDEHVLICFFVGRKRWRSSRTPTIMIS